MAKPNMKNLFKALFLFSILLISSCSSEDVDSKPATDGEKDSLNKGTIKYIVSYPYFEGEGIAKAMLPKEMYFVFNNGLINAYTKKGGLMKMGVMGSSKDDSVSMYLDFGNLDIRSNFSGAKIKRFIDSQTPLNIELVDGEEKEIAGFKCKKAIGKYIDGSNPDFTIWYTEELDIESPNFYNPYSSIPGVLMEYQMERFGLVSEIKAESFTKGMPEEHQFHLDTNFMQIQFQNFEDEIRSIFEKTIGKENLTSKPDAES
jgi:GLPGLI family protein